jgi:hypothetical protein
MVAGKKKNMARVASCQVARITGTHRSKRLPARGSASENDVGVVILENAEKSLESRLVTEAAGKFKTAIMSVRMCAARLLLTNAHLLYPEWLHMLSAGNH